MVAGIAAWPISSRRMMSRIAALSTSRQLLPVWLVSAADVEPARLRVRGTSARRASTSPLVFFAIYSPLGRKIAVSVSDANRSRSRRK